MRKEDKTQRTREKILASGIEEFGRNGYRRGSINAISASGINKGLIYHNYKDKDDLYLACVKRSFDDMVSSITDSLQDPSVDYSTARLRFFAQHESEARLFLESSVSPPEHLKKQIRDLRKPLEELNRTEFKKILDKQTLRPGISTEEAYRWFAYMEDAFNLAFGQFDSEEEDISQRLSKHETYAATFLDRILYGIAIKKEE
ncbi:MAG: TetR/AcrR family transcriptional regulator [Lachnospiraceae bacterium]|jgi:AcrR family transcriptional regulator|uniref:TetR/AcrR family transcriptional regulator n=1 Tax=Galactobacillus timonensis TaxID=2041840 RepID=UPI0023F52E52|nr:TetR/AcrR family transcriptional regulator [Galactobacillus timonensis]MCI6754369.1 TetR/AcrR family transcriptional regulator [Galactobacillus timonensis]MDD7086474.1 TetR/AcrR family transcriptional regulator [Galactobacillus timonensis]MDY5223117.1 TetR/AcrR family transcriptional regulator [Lachnospiraceae bacterium]